MRVQRQGQSLRLRVDEAELARLLDGEAVANETRWPDDRVTREQLVLGERHGWRRDADGWCVTLADTDVRDLAARLPSRVGLHVALQAPAGATLELLFDVDVRDSVGRRRGGRHEGTPHA